MKENKCENCPLAEAKKQEFLDTEDSVFAAVESFKQWMKLCQEKYVPKFEEGLKNAAKHIDNWSKKHGSIINELFKEEVDDIN